MKVLFHLYNSVSRCNADILRNLSWDAGGVEVACVHCGNANADQIQEMVTNAIAGVRRGIPDEVLLLIIHPGGAAAEPAGRMMLNDPFIIIALCSADPGGLAQVVKFEVADHVLVFPVALPDRLDHDFEDFRDEVEAMIEIVSRIESETVSDLTERKNRCRAAAREFVARRQDRSDWSKFKRALEAALSAPGEPEARFLVCERHYNKSREFLEAARRFDRDRQMTWMGELTRIHHLDLAPRFSNARDVFANDASAALEAWMRCDEELRRLLAGSFDFSVVRFAQCALQERGDVPVLEGVAGVIDLLDGMRDGLVEAGGDVFQILAAGMRELSCQITNLRDNWYFLK